MLSNVWLQIALQYVAWIVAVVSLIREYQSGVRAFVERDIQPEGWGPLDRLRLRIRTQTGREGVGVAPGGKVGVAHAALEYATQGWPWRSAFVFTGIALVLTFLIIGYVMRGIPVDDAAGSSAQLQAAVDNMGTKFWISAVGVFQGLKYQAIVGFLRARLSRQMDSTLERSGFQIVDEFEWNSRLLDEMRRFEKLQVDVREAVGVLHRDNISIVQRAEQQLRVLEEAVRASNEDQRANRESLERAAATVRNGIVQSQQVVSDQLTSLLAVAKVQQDALVSLAGSQSVWRGESSRYRQMQSDIASQTLSVVQSIREVVSQSEKRLAMIGSGVESVDQSLQDGLEPVVRNVERVADAVLGPKLDEFVAQIQRILDSQLLKHMGPIREEIRNQGSDEVLRALGEKMQSALTGGAADATRAFQETMANLSESMPGLLDGIRQAAANAERTSQDTRAQLTEAAIDSERRMSRLQELVERATDNVKTVMAAVESHSVAMVDSVSVRTRDVIDAVTMQTSASAEQVASRMDSMNELLVGAHRDYMQAVTHAREAMDKDWRRWSDTLTAFSAELVGAAGRMSVDRASAQALADHLSASAQELIGQRRAAEEVARTALLASERARDLLVGLQEHMQKESDVFERNRLQLEQIKDLRAELEASFGGIARSAGALLAGQLREINDQFELNGRRLSAMAEDLHSRVASPLVEAVEELHEIAKKLNQWPSGHLSAQVLPPSKGR